MSRKNELQPRIDNLFNKLDQYRKITQTTYRRNYPKISSRGDNSLRIRHHGISPTVYLKQVLSRLDKLEEGMLTLSNRLSKLLPSTPIVSDIDEPIILSELQSNPVLEVEKSVIIADSESSNSDPSLELQTINNALEETHEPKIQHDDNQPSTTLTMLYKILQFSQVDQPNSIRNVLNHKFKKIGYADTTDMQKFIDEIAENQTYDPIQIQSAIALAYLNKLPFSYKEDFLFTRAVIYAQFNSNFERKNRRFNHQLPIEKNNTNNLKIQDLIHKYNKTYEGFKSVFDFDLELSLSVNYSHPLVFANAVLGKIHDTESKIQTQNSLFLMTTLLDLFGESELTKIYAQGLEKTKDPNYRRACVLLAMINFCEKYKDDVAVKITYETGTDNINMSLTNYLYLLCQQNLIYFQRSNQNQEISEFNKFYLSLNKLYQNNNISRGLTHRLGKMKIVYHPPEVNT